MKKNKKHVVYLGWDGAYVMSRLPLVVKHDKHNDLPYLAHKGRRKYQTFDMGREGQIVFGHLKLKMFEVVKIEFATAKVVRP